MERDSCIVMYKVQYERRLRQAFWTGVGSAILIGVAIGYAWAYRVFS
jgi:hypothetical protein